jgi:hypothetical protein
MACSSPTTPSPTGQARELVRSQRQFQSLVGRNYQVTFENNCFCPVEVLHPVRLTIRNGAISEVARVADGTPLPSAEWHAYRTVDQVFAEIDAGLNSGARRVTVDYDSRYGYPREVLIDYQMAADAFVGFKLSNLQTLR